MKFFEEEGKSFGQKMKNCATLHTSFGIQISHPFFNLTLDNEKFKNCVQEVPKIEELKDTCIISIAKGVQLALDNCKSLCQGDGRCSEECLTCAKTNLASTVEVGQMPSLTMEEC